MSLPGNGGKAAVGIIDALKTNPLLLAILITNISLLAFVFYNERQHAHRGERIGQIVQSLFDRCLTLTHPPPSKTSLLVENSIQNIIRTDAGNCP
jgi:hypothetical protein